jgi:DNA-binding CsgD family transcriptional regulator
MFSRPTCAVCQIRHGSMRLTPRERDVLRQLAMGLTNRQMCARLGVTKNTLRTHLKTIRGKLGAADRAHMVAIARAHDLLPGFRWPPRRPEPQAASQGLEQAGRAT